MEFQYLMKKNYRINRKHHIDQVVFSYSDVSHEYVMHLACEALAAGADFQLINPVSTMLPSKNLLFPCARFEQAGKESNHTKSSRYFKECRKKCLCDSPSNALWRSGCPECSKIRYLWLISIDTTAQLKNGKNTNLILHRGVAVFAGVDYQAILNEAEKEADIIVWDGGNNDTPFYKSNLEIVVADPHRPGHEFSYYPGEVNLRRAHCGCH